MSLMNKTCENRNIIHIDDDPLWCNVVEKIIKDIPNVIYAGCVTSFSAGIALLQTTYPSVLVLDLRLPGGNGLDLASHTSTIAPATKILMLTVRTDEVVLFAASKPNVHGLVWKTPSALSFLPEAIAAVLGGHRYFPSEVKEALASFRRNPTAFFKLLSDRELALLPLIARGYTDIEIARISGIERATVKTHRRNIMSKLGLHSREHLIRWCMEKGFY
jgi:DNA-binding NarL/FixJ family response regulator